MSTLHTPGPTWQAIGLELAAIRTTARREKRRLGGVTPKTEQRLREVMAKAQAALAVDDIAKAKGVLL
jgi:hypothetical protein